MNWATLAFREALALHRSLDQPNEATARYAAYGVIGLRGFLVSRSIVGVSLDDIASVRAATHERLH